MFKLFHLSYRITNSYTHSRRIANSPEQRESRADILCLGSRSLLPYLYYMIIPSQPHWSKNKALVFQKAEALTAIECKLLVTGKECEVLGDSVGNDNMVAGVVVVLSLVERETGVSEHGSL